MYVDMKAGPLAHIMLRGLLSVSHSHTKYNDEKGKQEHVNYLQFLMQFIVAYYLLHARFCP